MGAASNVIQHFGSSSECTGNQFCAQHGHPLPCTKGRPLVNPHFMRGAEHGPLGVGEGSDAPFQPGRAPSGVPWLPPAPALPDFVPAGSAPSWQKAGVDQERQKCPRHGLAGKAAGEHQRGEEIYCGCCHGTCHELECQKDAELRRRFQRRAGAPERASASLRETQLSPAPHLAWPVRRPPRISRAWPKP